MIVTLPEPIRDRCDDLFALLFKKGIVGMTLHSLEHGWLAINEIFCDMLGYTHTNSLRWQKKAMKPRLSGSITALRPNSFGGGCGEG